MYCCIFFCFCILLCWGCLGWALDLYVQYKTHSGHVTLLSLTLSSSLCVCLTKGRAELHICRANSVVCTLAGLWGGGVCIFVLFSCETIKNNNALFFLIQEKYTQQWLERHLRRERERERSGLFYSFTVLFFLTPSQHSLSSSLDLCCSLSLSRSLSWGGRPVEQRRGNAPENLVVARQNQKP